MLRFAAHPVRAHRTGLPCSTNWFSLFPPENSLFDQTNSLFRGVGNSKLKPHDISGLGGFDPAYSRPNPRNSLFFPVKQGNRARDGFAPDCAHRHALISLILLRFLWISSPFSAQIPGACRCSGEGLRLAETPSSIDTALYDLCPATEPAGLGWTGGQACLNPSRFRWASQLSGRRVFLMSFSAVSSGGCCPSTMAVTMSGARELSRSNRVT